MNAHNSIHRANRKKYMGPPTWQHIEKVLKKTGMTNHHFETYYGINFNHLAQVKGGKRKLSISYWHIFYEFGKKPKRAKTQIPLPIPKTQTMTTDDYVHERFSILK